MSAREQPPPTRFVWAEDEERGAVASGRRYGTVLVASRRRRRPHRARLGLLAAVVTVVALFGALLVFDVLGRLVLG